MLCNGLLSQEISELKHRNSNCNCLPELQKLASGILGLIEENERKPSLNTVEIEHGVFKIKGFHDLFEGKEKSAYNENKVL